jgi:SNF2 family DNA or RNA helicase
MDISNLYEYQKKAVNRICLQKKIAVWMGCGLGKTITVLTAIEWLIKKQKVHKVLIVAPKNVVENVWLQESQLWEHTKNLRISLVIGSEKARIERLKADADIYCISRDLLYWLFDYEWFTADMLVIDEASGFKDRSTRRVASLLQKSITVGGKKLHRKHPMIAMFNRVVELTGTPASESYAGLWSQIAILTYGVDNPLERTLTIFKEHYMVAQNFNGFPVYTRMKYGAIDEINSRLESSGLCISMRTEDYVELPEKIEIVRYVTADDRRYKQMEKNSIITVDGVDIIANSALDKINKLQQISSDFVYDETGMAHILNSSKQQALEEILEGLDEPALILYRYEYEKNVLKKLGCVSLDNPKAIADWNAGKIKLGMLFPSTAYGLNIQGVCSVIIWYTQSLSGEQTEQATKRIVRQGNKSNKVRIFYIIKRNTVDEMVYNLIRTKQNVLDNLLNYFSESNK